MLHIGKIRIHDKIFGFVNIAFNEGDTSQIHTSKTTLKLVFMTMAYNKSYYILLMIS